MRTDAERIGKGGGYADGDPDFRQRRSPRTLIQTCATLGHPFYDTF